MRRFKLIRSRAGLVLGGAVMTMLLLPVAAFASGFSGSPSMYRHTGAVSGESASLGVVALVVFGVIAATVLLVWFVPVARRIDIGRKPAGVGPKPRPTA
jgi:hypothetical protein